MKRAKILVGLSVAAAGWFCCTAAFAAEAPADTAAAAKPVVTVSKETTYIVEPLRDDGCVDYMAALNQKWSEGVTPENNALVPLIKIFGPMHINENVRDRFFKLLGMDTLPEEGDYFVPFYDFARSLDLDEVTRRRAQRDEWEQAQNGPWSPEQLPIVAQWIARNSKHIDLAVKATRRPRYYTPLVAPEESNLLVMALLPTVSEVRGIARCLRMRAMLRVQEGNKDAAFQDLLACHRLARLVGQGPTLIDGLVAIALDHMGCVGDAALAHYGNLTEEEARRYAAALGRLPPLRPMVDRIDIAERYMCLDAICHIASQGPEGLASLDALSGSSSSPATRTMAQLLSRRAIDWDSILRKNNAWYDRMVAALRTPRGPLRDQAMMDFGEAIEQLEADSRGVLSLAGSLLHGKSMRTIVSDRLGNIFVSLFIPAVSMALRAEERSKVMLDLAELSYNLSAYRAVEGEYPPELRALVPKYLAELPPDRFGDGPYRYKRKGPGFIVYSVGGNGIDDNGVALWDDTEEEGDDFVIRVPAPE